MTQWESGLGSWTAGTRDVEDAATFDTDNWAAVVNLPGGRAGRAAFVANIDSGDCAADDETGALSLDSPSIAIPANVDVPRISLDHWFQTEFGWDGGNLNISVNGGEFNLIPDSALEYGSCTDTLFPALDEFGTTNNSNPLADQRAYTGTVDGALNGTWSKVCINLLGIAEGGDTIRLRLDFGIDACDGEIGWYVDDVEIYSCEAELPPSDCGNSVIDANEQCDDGNDFIDDGCFNSCQVEAGWECTDPTPAGEIADPGFEAGTPNPEWTEESNNPIGTPICSAAECGTGGGSGPSQGTYWAWFGGVANADEEGSLSQSVTIPDTLTELRFDLEVPACDSAADYLEVLIDGNRGWVVAGSGSRCGVDGYTTQSVDISDYADGDDHVLEFHSETFSNNGGVTNFFVDEVALPATGSQCTESGVIRLTLVKQVVNDDGGTAQASAWALAASGPTGFNGVGPSVSSGDGFAAGTYNLSESGGPAGYSASGWNCTGGGNPVDQDTITLQSGDNATCTITNDDVDPGFQINFGHSGAWYFPDTSGQGQFIDIEPEKQFMFLAWFTYTEADSENELEQDWLTAEGFYSGNTAELILYETSGGIFDDSQEVTSVVVGEAIVEFSDCQNGTLTYRFDTKDLEGEFPLVRAIPGSGNVCSEQEGSGVQAVDINVGMDGSCYEPATSGQGFFIDVHDNGSGGNFVFLSWFTYGDNTASGRRWLTAEGQMEGSTAELVIYDTNGGAFDDPLPPESVVVGSMMLDFIDCDNAVLTYSLPGESLEGEIPITRVVPLGEAFCEELAGTE